VLNTSENPIVAAELAMWLNTDEESTMLFATEQFLFPARTAILESDELADLEAEFYGGQKVNKLFAEISTTVATDFEWLPFTDYSFSSFNDTIGKAISEKGDLKAGLDAWQADLVKYATEQGFTVK
jgi:multiple sugar transport system substrate-binding protein